MTVIAKNVVRTKAILLTAFFATMTVLLVSATPSSSCPGCNSANKLTFPKECESADIVMFGSLSNAKWTDANGTTDLDIEIVLKDHKLITGKKKIVLDRGIGVPENKKINAIIFASVFNNTIDPYRIVQDDDKSICAYMQGALKLPEDDMTKRLAYFFHYLDNNQLEISLDAYRAFAHANTEETIKAAKVYDRQKLLTWLADPKTPKYRVSLYGYLLGISGKPEDAKILRDIIDNCDLSMVGSIEGPMVGFALLDTKDGLDRVVSILHDSQKDYQIRYGALQAARILLKEFPKRVDRKKIFDAMAKAVVIDDSADLFVDELRHWEQWSYTKEVIATMSKPDLATQALLRRAVIRFALRSPESEGREYITALRKSEPRLVADLEEFLKYEENARKQEEDKQKQAATATATTKATAGGK